MTQTMDTAGRPLFFPASMDTDEAGVILTRPIEELAPLVATIAPNRTGAGRGRCKRTAASAYPMPTWICSPRSAAMPCSTRRPNKP